MTQGNWPDEQLVQLAALQHYSYCPRQYALIHIEQTFDENIFTLRGQVVHQQVDQAESVVEKNVRVERALPLFCDRLGLIGKADVVEFHGDIQAGGKVFPIEYKRGNKKHSEHDQLQLCAQAVCLEEMLGVPVDEGALFYHASRRRVPIAIDEPLRARLEQLTAEVRVLQIARKVPVLVNDKRCEQCSLRDSCQPELAGLQGAVSNAAAELYSSDDLSC